jgi:hypothetical protein
MDMSKRAAVAISGLMFAGAVALSVGAATPASADNGAGGGGGGGTNFYNPNQHYNPNTFVNDPGGGGLLGGLLGDGLLEPGLQ